LNTIPKGHIRAACFKSDQLVAVGYKNEKQKDMLQEIIAGAFEYRRNKPLSFVKFSDAHTVSDVGVTFTYIKLEKINFDALKNAFSNPSELISIERPSLAKILNRLIHKENSFFIPEITDSSINKFHKLICGLNNSTGGYILIGVTDEKNKVGIEIVSVFNQFESESCFIVLKDGERIELKDNYLYNRQFQLPHNIYIDLFF